MDNYIIQFAKCKIYYKKHQIFSGFVEIILKEGLTINVAMELAGHSSITTTQIFYLQVDEYHRPKAAEVVENLVSVNGVHG
jgi:site-specific recombinase XerD